MFSDIVSMYFHNSLLVRLQICLMAGRPLLMRCLNQLYWKPSVSTNKEGITKSNTITRMVIFKSIVFCLYSNLRCFLVWVLFSQFQMFGLLKMHQKNSNVKRKSISSLFNTKLVNTKFTDNHIYNFNCEKGVLKQRPGSSRFEGDVFLFVFLRGSSNL